MQVERCLRLYSEMDFIVRRTKFVAALRTGLTTTGAGVWHPRLTLDGDDLAPALTAHIARPEVKGFNTKVDHSSYFSLSSRIASSIGRFNPEKAR
jgi:hypothetical protein